MAFATDLSPNRTGPALALCRGGGAFADDRTQSHHGLDLPDREESYFASPGRYALMLRFALVNMTAAALLGAAHFQGWLSKVAEADDTGMSLVIALVFLAGLALCGHKLFVIDGELARLRDRAAGPRSWSHAYLAEIADRDSGSRAILAASLRLKVSNSIAIIRLFSNSLVILGLIGTVVGFIIAFAGVDSVAAGDPGSVGPMVTNLIRGLSVALYTTLVGSVLNVWLNINYRLLSSGAVSLTTALIARGEADERY